MRYDFDEIIDRTEAISVKWSPELRRRMYGSEEPIPMGIADMDFRTSPAVARAVRDPAAHETYGYA